MVMAAENFIGVSLDGLKLKEVDSYVLWVY
ncbi:MAG: hypothetical protein FD151_1525 [bacterium]|nr:MAG: hypothetical protein FD151_1525 [bacterium]